MELLLFHFFTFFAGQNWIELALTNQRISDRLCSEPLHNRSPLASSIADRWRKKKSPLDEGDGKLPVKVIAMVEAVAPIWLATITSDYLFAAQHTCRLLMPLSFSLSLYLSLHHFIGPPSTIVGESAMFASLC